MNSKAEQRFIRLNLISIISLFLLILAGGIVRSSGSGMGCPDWPKCFDQYIPPTDISQLPKDYQKRYVAQRMEKNERFAKLLEKSGYADLAQKIRNDENIRVPEEFNPTKTYTEYVNRLIGALTGIFLLLTFIFSISIFKQKPVAFWLSGINLLLVVIQAWLGSIVVSTNLLAWMITVHMLLAILILAISIYTYHCVKAKKNRFSSQKSIWDLKLVTLLAIVVSLVQIIIGTEVRETVDAVQSEFPELRRADWLNEVGRIFLEHKQLALAVIAVNILLFLLIKRRKVEIANLGLALILILLAQMITGFVLANFNLAPWAQATHVLFATLFFGCQFYILLILGEVKSNII